MRKISVEIEAPKVEINGIVFEVQASDGDIYRMGRETVAKCMALNVEDADAVRKVIESICETIDYALGKGAVVRIAQGKPININAALKLLNAIVEDCASRYRPYVQNEYLRGGKHA